VRIVGQLERSNNIEHLTQKKLPQKLPYYLYCIHIYFAGKGLPIPGRGNQSGIFQFLHMVGNRRSSNTQMTAGPGKGLIDPPGTAGAFI
jgi:hypothetical protein